MPTTHPASTTTERSDTFVGRRLAAVVFVDIVSSTELLVELRDDAWIGLLDALDTRVDALLEAFGGTLSNRLGDGYLLVFDGASSAVQFGDAVHRVAAELELELRVGIHVGEVQDQRGQTVGIAVHAAARVQGAAEPGETLVTEAVTAMTLGTGIDYLPRGEAELKGLPGRWRLWTVA